jgi:hypothetical protein
MKTTTEMQLVPIELIVNLCRLKLNCPIKNDILNE